MFISFVDTKRKTLETGAVPTENLPSKRHDSKPSYRRPLVREISSECPSTSALPPVDIEGESANVIDESFEELVPRVKETLSLPWIIKEGSDLGIRMEHWDNNYSIPKFVLHVDQCLQFSLHIFNWLLAEDHSIYTAHRRRITSAGVGELLQSLENDDFLICEGLQQHTEYLTTIAKDPDDQTHQLQPSDVVRHSIPKSIDMDKNFGVLAVFRCINCQVLLRKEDQVVVICDPCKQLQRKIVAQQNRKSRQSSAPAKDKAPLSRCSAEKLRATVVESRLECSVLKAKVKSMQAQIENDSIAVSETLDEQILVGEIEIPGYNIFRKDRGGKGGGVLVFVRSDLSVARRCELEDTAVEGLWLEILLPKSRGFLLGTFYRLPNSSHFYNQDFVLTSWTTCWTLQGFKVKK